MKKELIPILLVTLANMLNFTILIPVMPFLNKQYGGGEIMYGVLLAIFPLFQFFAAPVLGTMSDHFGRRPVLIISQAGTVVGWFIFMLAYFVPQTIGIGPFMLPVIIIMIARAVDGITGGNNSVANAWIIDKTEATDRSKIFGMIGGVVGFGLIIGPGVGGYTASLGLSYLGPAIVGCVLAIITLIFMYLYLPESLDKEHRRDVIHFSIKDEFQFITKIQKYTSDRTIKYLFFIRTSFLLCFSASGTIFVLYLIDNYHLNEQQVGLFFLLVGAFLMFNQAVLSQIIIRRFGDMKTFLLGQVAAIIAFAAATFPPVFLLFVPIVYGINFGFSMSFPTYRAIISSRVDRSQQGEINGIDESLFAATSAIAPIIAGIVYAHAKNYTYGFLSIFLTLSFVIFISRYKSHLKES